MKRIKITGVIVLALLLLTPFGAFSASLNGTYVVYNFDSGFHGGDPNGGWGANDEQCIMRTEVTFDGAGVVTSSYNEYGQNREIAEVDINQSSGEDRDWVRSNKFITTAFTDSGTETGTYTVSDDGTFELIFSVGEGETETITGTVSEDGNTVVLGYSEFEGDNQYCSFGIGMGVKKGNTRTLPTSIYLLLLTDD